VSPLLTLPLLRVEPVTPRARLLTLDLGGSSLAYRPGQAVMAGLHGQAVRRPYSIACSPGRAAARSALELLVGVNASGSAGPHLTPLTPGAAIDIEGPMGAFTLPEQVATSDLLFVGGGTGIAPLRAMIDHAVAEGAARRLVLFYSARQPDEFAFIDELRAHEHAGHLELHQTVTRESAGWPGRTGRIDRDQLRAALREPEGTLCFVCGPAAMVEEGVDALARLGVPDDAIRTEWRRR